jgi:hypothetical protein
MANQVIRLSDVVVPEVYTPYLIQDSIKTLSFYRSGILEVDPELTNFLAGGGDQITIPFWNRDTSDAQAVQSGTEILTSKLTTSSMVGRRLLFAKGWSAEEIASALAGDSAFERIRSTVDTYWNEFMQKVLFYSIKGVLGDNDDSDSGDLINDITTSGTPGTANKISSSAVVDTYALMGDKSDFSAVAMHSTPYYALVNANLIDFEPTNTQNIGFGTYLGLTVVVCDQLTPDTDGSNSEYLTLFFKRGAIRYAESGARITPVEVDRKAEMSEDRLFTRRQFIMHPYGFKWTETSVNEDMPELREIGEAGNWDRVFQKKNCGFVGLVSNG